MRRLALALAAFAALAACDREPVRTVVIAPQDAASVPAPVASTPVAPATAPAADSPAPLVQPAASAVPAVTPAPQAQDDGAALLAERPLIVPVAGIPPESLTDMFDHARGGRRHEAIDIMAARGTPVHAVDDGTLAKLFNSVPGGLTVYQFDPQKRLTYYYAHLDRYAEGLKEGMALRRGDLIGYVGSTGNANPQGPHLHFAVFRLGPQKQWWKGEAVNPYQALRKAQPAPG
jgi:murein DD-endopeptidase MepM/ murein hydrolase activator NlpD